MEVLNDGTHTFYKSNYSAALDVTAVMGVAANLSVSWRVLDDDIKSDHSPIEFTIGEVYNTERVKRRDWKNMDWDAYTEESRIPLQCLIRD